MTNKKTHQFGILAERITILFLRLKGYKILFWRYKTVFGEIDIIAKKGKMIVVIEVKARKSKTAIEELLQPKQVSRIKKTTELFLANNTKFRKCPIRFDFVMMNKFYFPRHLRGYF